MRHAVILAGGSGTRLWPASRRERPKQLLPLIAGESLLAATVRRGRRVADDRISIVTVESQRAATAAEAPGATIIAEPMGRNTAVALGLAAVHLLHRDPAAVIGAFPADHHVADDAAWASTAERAFAAAEARNTFCLIGVKPSRPETGFGYLEVGGVVDDLTGAVEITRFTEKPAAAQALALVAGGQHWWNAGMFFVPARHLLDELGRHLPGTRAALDEVAAALARGAADDEVATITAACYPRVPAISVDHGILEKTSGVVAVAADFAWSDVGSWVAVAELTSRDQDGNAVIGEAVVLDGHDNLVVSDSNKLIAVLGCSDLVVVQAGDAVLVMPRGRAQDLRSVVDALTAQHRDRFL